MLAYIKGDLIFLAIFLFLVSILLFIKVSKLKKNRKNFYSNIGQFKINHIYFYQFNYSVYKEPNFSIRKNGEELKKLEIFKFVEFDFIEGDKFDLSVLSNSMVEITSNSIDKVVICEIINKQSGTFIMINKEKNEIINELVGKK